VQPRSQSLPPPYFQSCDSVLTREGSASSSPTRKTSRTSSPCSAIPCIRWSRQTLYDLPAAEIVVQPHPRAAQVAEVVRAIANAFIGEGRNSDCIIIGINSIRELCQRQPLCMDSVCSVPTLKLRNWNTVLFLTFVLPAGASQRTCRLQELQAKGRVRRCKIATSGMCYFRLVYDIPRTCGSLHSAALPRCCAASAAQEAARTYRSHGR
jgi:hypothetical protein